MNENDIVREMLERYNAGQIDLSDEDAERLAMSASQHGERFAVESKPFSKGAFDFADMATFGLLPDEWRPHSAGQTIHGETGIDRVSSFVSSLAGMATGVGAATKGAKLGWNAIKKTFARKKADDIATGIYKGNIIDETKLLPAGPNIPQLGHGTSLALPGPGVGRAGQLPGPYPQLGRGPYKGYDTQQMLDDMRRQRYIQKGGYIPEYQIGGFNQQRQLGMNPNAMQPGVNPMVNPPPIGAPPMNNPNMANPQMANPQMNNPAMTNPLLGNPNMNPTAPPVGMGNPNMPPQNPNMAPQNLNMAPQFPPRRGY